MQSAKSSREMHDIDKDFADPEIVQSSLEESRFGQAIFAS